MPEPSIAKKSRRNRPLESGRRRRRSAALTSETVTAAPGREGSTLGRERAAEGGVEELVLLGAADADAQRVRRAEARERPHDDALGEQTSEELDGGRVGLDVEE